MRLVRRSFSILEILVTIAIITMMGGVIAWSLSDLLSYQKFNGDIEQFKNLIQEIQIEAMALQSDMEIHLSRDKHWRAKTITSEKILKNRVLDLKNIQEIKEGTQPLSSIHLKIYSTGRITPSKVLVFQGNKDHYVLDLRLPLQIKFSKDYPLFVDASVPAKLQKKEKKNGNQ